MGARGGFSVSGMYAFWMVLVKCISLVLVFPVDWFCIVLKMLWLFSVYVWRMGSVSFVMVVTAFVRYLLMLSSVGVKWGYRAVFGIWVRELLSVGSL